MYTSHFLVEREAQLDRQQRERRAQQYRLAQMSTASQQEPWPDLGAVLESVVARIRQLTAKPSPIQPVRRPELGNS